MKPKVTVKWSKKENDWITKYPEWKNRNARIVGIFMMDMIRVNEEYMSKDWTGKPTEFKDFRSYLIEGGFDPDTFTMSVKALTGEELEIKHQP